MTWSSTRRRAWLAGGVLVVLPVACHFAVIGATHVPAPAGITLPDDTVTHASDDPSRRELGDSYVRARGRILEVRLVGDAVTIGHAHASLLYDHLVDIERHMHEQFAFYVPWSVGRSLIVDLARVRFRNLDDNLDPAQRLEIAAQAATFRPDPFDSLMGTYQRFVFLHSLYDIMLSFERSPLVGCTSVVLGPESTADGRTLLGRNFDFEGPRILDDHKAVFLMLERGRIPYASVSWPGFVGTASGMNLEGVAVVIHGARAGEPRPDGEPVAHTVRDLLARAHTTAEALALLGGRDPMVPHMLLVADGAGDAAVVERIPGEPPFIRRRAGAPLPLTNHFEGPGADDPKNLEVMARTSSTKRRSRLDEIASNLPKGANVQDVVAILRDKKKAGGGALALGHRSAIDALIATHSVVMDATRREIWVNEGPHASGRYVRFDLRELLAKGHGPRGPASVETLPVDDITADGRYDAWVGSGARHEGAE